MRVLNEWITQLKMPSLAVYDVRKEHIGKIVAGSRGSSMKTNPILLTDEEIALVRWL